MHIRYLEWIISLDKGVPVDVAIACFSADTIMLL